MSAAPEYLALGHVTRDLQPDGTWRLGGTAYFAARTAQRHGLRVAVLTSAPPDVLLAFREALPEVEVRAVPSAQATTYENSYAVDGSRRQHVRAVAAPLTAADLPDAWRHADIVHLAPLADELGSDLVAACSGTLTGATPQGWIRCWDSTGCVRPGDLMRTRAMLPRLGALILSLEDLLPAPGDLPLAGMPADETAALAVVREWAQAVPTLVVTRGREGALVWRDGSVPQAVPGYRVAEVDPTGAGDVFAAAFLAKLHDLADALAAAGYANKVAALSIEHMGADGIPSPDEVVRRFGR